MNCKLFSQHLWYNGAIVLTVCFLLCPLQVPGLRAQPVPEHRLQGAAAVPRAARRGARRRQGSEAARRLRAAAPAAHRALRQEAGGVDQEPAAGAGQRCESGGLSRLALPA